MDLTVVAPQAACIGGSITDDDTAAADAAVTSPVVKNCRRVGLLDGDDGAARLCPVRISDARTVTPIRIALTPIIILLKRFGLTVRQFLLFGFFLAESEMTPSSAAVSLPDL